MRLHGAAILLAACAGAACRAPGGDPAASAAAAAGAITTVFDLLDDQLYIVPAGVPSEILDVPSPYFAGAFVSLADGNVTSAWTTVPEEDGTPPSIVYRCVGGVWVGAADARLAPLGVDLTAEPDLLPFAARARGAVFTLDAQTALGGSFVLPSHSELRGAVEVTIPYGGPGDLPIARARKIGGQRAGLFAAAAIDRANYVLRLDTRGGAGPGAGSPCTEGDAEIRDPYQASYWFVRIPFLPRTTGSGQDADLPSPAAGPEGVSSGS